MDGSNVVHESFFKNMKFLLKIPTMRWLCVGIGMFCLPADFHYYVVSGVTYAGIRD